MGLRQWPSESCNKPSCPSASKQRTRLQRPKQRSVAAMSLRLPLLWCSPRCASSRHAGHLQHSAQRHVYMQYHGFFATAVCNAIAPCSCTVAIRIVTIYQLTFCITYPQPTCVYCTEGCGSGLGQSTAFCLLFCTSIHLSGKAYGLQISDEQVAHHRWYQSCLCRAR